MADEDLNPVPQLDPAPGPVPAAPAGAGRCLVVDATPALQAWVDEFYGLLPVISGPDSEHPVELPEGTVVVTVAAVWRAVDRAFSTEDDVWSIATMGLPVLDGIEWDGPANTGNPGWRWWCAVFGC